VQVQTGRIRIGTKDHIWARYCLGEGAALSTAVGREMLTKTKEAYADVVGGLSLELFAREQYSHGLGPFVKSYFLPLGETEFTAHCALGLGTAADMQSEFRRREALYDEVVSTFEPSASGQGPS
jgi:hypothetical protein